MRLRAIEVRNWACIEELSLDGLDDGVIVLYGPNGTGKSRLVQAIRSCLFDHFHDSQDEIIRDAVPRTTRAVPRVAIEFDHAGKRYRIDKTFAKSREGEAVLERIDGRQRRVLARGKDATYKVRELIGLGPAERGVYSEKGVFQMLWLRQQDIHLPRQLDAGLAGALEAVLGTLVTGRDLDFKERIDAACERWFTPRTMKDKKESPISRLEEELAQARDRLEEINREWQNAESDLRDYDAALARQPQLEFDLSQAERELSELQKQRDAIRVRLAQYQQACDLQTQCRKQADLANKRLEEYAAQHKQLDEGRVKLIEQTQHLEAARQKRLDAERSAKESKTAFEQAEKLLQEHRSGRPLLEDRRRLLVLRAEIAAVDEKLRQVEDLDRRRQELEKKLAGTAAVSKVDLRGLRENRRRAADCRSRLEAGEIQLRLQALRGLAIVASADGGDACPVNLESRQLQHWLVRQQAEIRLADAAGEVAIIQVGRGQEDRTLEALAAELIELDEAYRRSLAAAQLDADDPGALDRLVERRTQHDEWSRQLQEVRSQLAQLAPQGIPALHALRSQKTREHQIIVERRPDLSGWTPQLGEVERQAEEFAAHESKLQQAVDVARQQFERLDKSRQEAADSEQLLATRIAELEGVVKALSQQLAGQDRAALEAAVADARRQLDAADAKVKETTLSDADRLVEEQYQASLNAKRQREQRCRENHETLIRLQARLEGTEGLHQKRIQAEQDVHDCVKELDRERIRSQAYRRIKELFEEIRQQQVRRTVGPINDRVMQWCRRLGLTDYAGLSFGDQLLPEGLVLADGAGGEPVAFDKESYGTIEQLSLLIRLAVGGLLAADEPTVAILDDPVTNADDDRHRRMLEIIDRAARGDAAPASAAGANLPAAGPLQILIFTCQPKRFDYLAGAQQFNLQQLIRRGSRQSR